MLKKSSLFLYLALIAHTVSYSQSYGNLENIINSYSKNSTLKNAQWSVTANYVESGKTIISHNSHFSLSPASGLKLFTSAAALEILGEDHRFETKLYYEGKISDSGVLDGNIYIYGGGDPSLGSSQVEGALELDDLMESWKRALLEKGIRKIDGKIIADDFYYDRIPIPDNWQWIDIGNYYGASNSSLSINDNLYYLYFKPGKNVGDIAEVLEMTPEIPNLKFNNFMKTGARGSGDNGYIYCAPGMYDAALRGTVPAGVSKFSIKGSIPDPPLFAAQYFTAYLNNTNLPVSENAEKLEEKKEYKSSSLLTVTISPPLKNIIYILNKRSFNLYAEQLVKAIGKHDNGEGSTENGIKSIMDFLKKKKINSDGIDLTDGSGLSRTNTITTKSMVQLLTAMKDSKYFDSFYNSLGVAGDPDDPGFFKSYGIRY